MTHSLFVYPSDLLTRPELDDRVCVLLPGETKTWGRFVRDVNGWKLAFQAGGYRRVALYGRNVYESAAQLFGAWAANVTAVLPSDTSPGTCRRLTEQGIVEAAAGQFNRETFCLPVVTPIATDEPCRDRFDETLPLIELFTSGSTGTPCRIVKRLRQLFVEVQSIETRRHGSSSIADSDTCIISTVSQQHIYGLLFFLLWSFSSARMVWGERIEYPEQLIDRLRLAPKWIWIASPAHLKRMPSHLNWHEASARIATVYSSGGPLFEDGLTHVHRLLGQTPVELLGSSESGGIAWRQRCVQDDGTITSTAWHALPAVQWRCENGLLCIRSPQLSSDDWETTSDKIVPVDDESFQHVGRADRIVKIEEKRVSLSQIETLLSSSPWIETAKAFQLNDTKRSLVVAACPKPEGVLVIRDQGKAGLTKTLKDLLAQHVERVCLPRYWRFTWALPENSMGKTTVSAAERLFEPTAIQAVALERDNAHARLLLTVPQNCPYFEGHFPKFPILPGVTQLDWADRLARQLFPGRGRLSGVKTLKFMRPIFPNTTVVLDLILREDGCVDFAYATTSDEPHAKGRLLYV